MNREEAVLRYSKILESVRDTEDYWKSFAVIQFTVALSRLLKQKKLKQKDLARMLGVEPPYITKIMHGRENFTVSQMVKLASALGAVVHIHLAKKGVNVRWEEELPAEDASRSAAPVAVIRYPRVFRISTAMDYSIDVIPTLSLTSPAPSGAAMLPDFGHEATIESASGLPPVTRNEVLYGKVVGQAAHA